MESPVHSSFRVSSLARYLFDLQMQHPRISRVEVLFSCTSFDAVSLSFPSDLFPRSSILFSALLAMSEIQVLFAQRPIILRHQKAALYHPFIEAAAMTLVDIPITAITLLVFATIVYEAVRLQQSAGQFLYVSLFESLLTALIQLLIIVYSSCSCSRST